MGKAGLAGHGYVAGVCGAAVPPQYPYSWVVAQGPSSTGLPVGGGVLGCRVVFIAWPGGLRVTGSIH